MQVHQQKHKTKHYIRFSVTLIIIITRAYYMYIYYVGCYIHTVYNVQNTFPYATWMYLLYHTKKQMKNTKHEILWFSCLALTIYFDCSVRVLKIHLLFSEHPVKNLI